MKNALSFLVIGIAIIFIINLIPNDENYNYSFNNDKYSFNNAKFFNEDKIFSEVRTYFYPEIMQDTKLLLNNVKNVEIEDTPEKLTITADFKAKKGTIGTFVVVPGLDPNGLYEVEVTIKMNESSDNENTTLWSGVTAQEPNIIKKDNVFLTSINEEGNEISETKILAENPDYNKINEYTYKVEISANANGKLYVIIAENFMNTTEGFFSIDDLNVKINQIDEEGAEFE